MIGSGVYLDDIKIVLKQKEKEFQQKIMAYFLQILLFAIALFLSSIAISRYFTFLIQKDIENIQNVLKNVSVKYENINLEKIQFKEFKRISISINTMIQEIFDLHTNLEEKVKLRTKELKKSEQFALGVVKSQDKFLKNSIHEINTPLSIIITNIDLFKLKFDKNKYISKIEAGSKIIHNIYNDLSYLIKKDRIKYSKSDIDFSKFILQRMEFFDEVAIGNNLQIESIVENKIFVNFNEIQLQRLIDNTISNAIKYSYENNTIKIKLSIENNLIYFSITNTGDTIVEPNKLFERFYRENESRGGFGIGLNIIKEICDNNDVTINLDSKNNLTTFSYIFEV